MYGCGYVVVLCAGSISRMYVEAKTPLMNLFCCMSYHREQVAAKCDVEALPAIRLLMREMEVAIREENYEEAARLRDHPWMRLADDIKMHR